MTNLEKDRLVEVIFFLYFNGIPDTIINKKDFWEMLKKQCDIYNIDSFSIQKSIRALTFPENRPTDEEIVYLMNKIDVSVRNLSKISGIYWQKKIAIEKDLEGKTLKIFPKITDVVMKRAMRDFIKVQLEINGILKYFSEEQFDKVI